MNKRFSTLVTLAITALGLTQAQPASSLRALAEARGLLIGAAVDPGVLFDTFEPDYAKVLFENFSIIGKSGPENNIIPTPSVDYGEGCSPAAVT